MTSVFIFGLRCKNMNRLKAHTLIFHICHSSVDQISRPTNSPHMAPCIGTCFLGYYDVYTHFPCWIRVDSGRGQQRAPHDTSPRSVVIQTLRPALVWLREMHRGPVSVSSDRQIGAISIRTRVAERGVLFRSACWNRIHPFQGSLEGRRRNEADERLMDKDREELPLSQCHRVNLIQASATAGLPDQQLCGGVLRVRVKAEDGICTGRYYLNVKMFWYAFELSYEKWIVLFPVPKYCLFVFFPEISSVCLKFYGSVWGNLNTNFIGQSFGMKPHHALTDPPFNPLTSEHLSWSDQDQLSTLNTKDFFDSYFFLSWNWKVTPQIPPWAVLLWNMKQVPSHMRVWVLTSICNHFWFWNKGPARTTRCFMAREENVPLFSSRYQRFLLSWRTIIFSYPTQMKVALQTHESTPWRFLMVTPNLQQCPSFIRRQLLSPPDTNGA